MIHTSSVRVVTTTEQAAELAGELARAPRIALDLESDGLFAYRARVCMIQLAWGGSAGGAIAVVDALATRLSPLAEVLGETGPTKIVHDVAFDARLLAEAGVELGNVHDTALAARMLGRPATGLASVLQSELGVTVSKEMQQHDWRERPLTDDMLYYLASDVAHLEPLDDALFGAVAALGIADEVAEETRHRLGGAIAAVKSPDPRLPYQRMKNVEKVSGPALAIVRRLADAREREASLRDVPPYKVISAEALVAVAEARPGTMAQLRRMRGVGLSSPAAEAFAEEMLRAILAGVADGRIPEDERAQMQRPRVPPEAAKARRARESKLTAWRRAEAKLREVDEQVVLPGHCLKAIADLEAPSTAALAAVPGIGAFRVARYGEAILRALAEPLPSPEAAT